MSVYGVRVRDATGAITFDSSAENVLFPIDEKVIAGTTVGTGLVYSYPAHTGNKIVAMLTSPYQTGDIDGCAVQSCRVSYSSSGVPVVTVFVENANTAYPVADGYLVVFSTGGNQ